MKEIINCAFCEATAILSYENKEVEFRKESYKYKEFYYTCNECSEDFTTTEIDTVSINQVYNQYREKHDLLFPEELLSLRSFYGLSAVKMSQVLGLGINAYSNYEKGEVPSLSNSNLIKSIKNISFFRSLLDSNKDLFSPNTYRKILLNLERLTELKDKDSSCSCRINLYDRPNKFTGYTMLNSKKIENLILYFLAKCNPDYNDKLKINKLLFYTDFSNYKINGSSVTGLSYRAIQHGPIPSHYENIFSSVLEKENLIEANFVESSKGHVYELFTPISKYDLSFFSEIEIEQIDRIIEKFKNMSTWELVELSHKEQAWIDLNGSKEIINYQDYAFDLMNA